MDIDLKTIRELLAVVGNTDITELTIESGDQRITVKKAPVGAVVVQHTEASPIAAPMPAAAATMSFEPKGTGPQPAKEAPPPPLPEPAVAANHVPITSPMVGTFYSSPSPTAPPFVNIGDHVNIGQTVCIIEAMKLMNDMPSEVAGKIVKVLVENGTTVEYGQPLFMVDPKG